MPSTSSSENNEVKKSKKQHKAAARVNASLATQSTPSLATTSAPPNSLHGGSLQPQDVPEPHSVIDDASPCTALTPPHDVYSNRFLAPGDAGSVQTSPLADVQRRHCTDSGNYRHPALASAAPSTPAPPEWMPAWPADFTSPSNPSRLVTPPQPLLLHQELHEPMYAIRSASDVSVASDGNTVVNQTAMTAGELAVPRRITAADALGSINIGTVPGSDPFGKPPAVANHTGAPGTCGISGAMAKLSPTSTVADRPPTVVGSIPFGRAQSGVYIHSIPSASEAEVPSSPSDSDDAARFAHRPLDPPGHVAKPVSASTLRTTSTLESMSHRFRRGTSSRMPRASSDALFSPPRSSDTGAGSILHPLPTDADADEVMWTKWDSLDARRLLLLGYQSGAIQVWDVTELDAVYEVLNLSGTFSKSSAPLSASILPTPPGAPPSSPRTDGFVRVRPLLMVLLNTAELCVYSLASHALVKRVAVGSTLVERPVKECDLHVSESFIVVSTVSAIHNVSAHILSAYDLTPLHTIPLSPGGHLPAISLSRRLLAVSLPPFTNKSPRYGRAPTLQSGMAVLKDGASRAGSIQTEVATTARGVWSGISSAASNALGGLMSGASGPASSSSSGRWPFSRSAPNPSVLAEHPPASSGPTPHRHGNDRRLSNQASLTAFRGLPGANLLKWSPNSDLDNPEVSTEPAKPQWIALYDLQPLLDGMRSLTDEPAAPFLLAHFPFNLSSPSPTAAPSQPTALGLLSSISALSISPSGSLLAVGDGDGTMVKVFHVRSQGSLAWRDAHPVQHPVSPRPPRPPSLSSSPTDVFSSPLMRRRSSVSSSSSRSTVNPGARSDASSTSATVAGAGVTTPSRKNVWHVYDLVRGITRATVESIVWSHDERWVGVGTATGTLHIFATNPYGGPSDEDSHIDGRVRNIMQFQPLSTTLQSLARIHTGATSRPRTPNMTGTQKSDSQFSFSFTFPPISTSLKSHTFDPRKPASPVAASFAASRRQTTAFQDVLLIVPAAGRLELHRATVVPSMKPVQPAASAQSVSKTPPRVSPSKTSISLPTSGLTHMMQAVRGSNVPGLRAHIVQLATWDVKKDREWDDVKGEFHHEKAPNRRTYAHDWLSEAELSTSTTSAAMLPGSIYLAHQFSFHAFTDDWQALLHRGLLDLPSTKLEVRPEVRANLIMSGTSSIRGSRSDTESFVQDSAITGSPFDEPMSTAIHARLEPTPMQPPILPSYPNGLQGHPQSWRDAAVPLRHAAAGLSEGVGEGLGRLRRELGKVAKTPRRGARKRDSLTFDEKDAVSPVTDASHSEQSAARLTQPGDSPVESGSTVSTTNVATDATDPWDEWRETEVADDVAEYEAFESFGLGVVGEMDEDHETSGQHVKQQLRQQLQPASYQVPDQPEAHGAPRPPPKQALRRTRRTPDA